MSDKSLEAGIDQIEAAEQVADIHETVATHVDGAETHSRTAVWCVWTVSADAFAETVAAVLDARHVTLQLADNDAGRVTAEHVAWTEGDDE